MDTVILRGYKFSVYNRIARVVLEEKGVEYTTVEVDPFTKDQPKAYLKLHPFGRVPTLSHNDFNIYETSAIARYIDAEFEGPPLAPQNPAEIARMAQVIAIADNYGYQPMIRQVFAHGVFRPLMGEVAHEEEVERGLDAARTVLSALETIAAEELVLDESNVTLADCHLAPMMAYFVAAPDAAEMLAGYRSLARWWNRMKSRQSLVQTDPGQPTPSKQPDVGAHEPNRNG